MKILLLVCASLVAGTPILQGRSMPTSVYDYYDFVEIPKIQPIASSRSDGPLRGLLPSSSGPLPRRIPLPLPPRRPPPPNQRPFSDPRPQQTRLVRKPDYQLAASEAFQPQYRPKPKPHQQRRPQYPQQPQKQPLRKPEPQFYDYQEEPLYPLDDAIFVEQSQYPKESVDYQDEQPLTKDAPEHYDYGTPLFQEERRPQYQEERRPQYKEERRPQYQEERRPQYQEERRPQYQAEKRPQYQEVRRPQYQEEKRPEYQEERPPHYYEEERPQYQEEPLPRFEEPSEKDFNRPPLNNYRTTPQKEPVKEKRDAIHSDGHFDANGVKFAADASAVENAKGAGRLAFQIHGQQGPHSYRFGYDTGKGDNRQFRYEERDGHGQVHGRYGFYGKDGKLQVVNYSAHPEHGFSADVPPH